MSDSAVQIANLLYRYAECMDSGDWDGVGTLFQHARLKTRDSHAGLSAPEFLQLLYGHVKRYPCGTPRTRHVVTNPIIEIDEPAHRATARSYYTVLQATEGFPLQPIAAGRYHDAFERVDDVWRFSFRDYSLLDMAGDLHYHLNGMPAQ
ncbi:nuclear transport factor 2 family protein [Paraburkholderia pallida]|uniref:Nuclear transport factor 2 family protein n=1 Tax=Paraburkholderia pallida TaxID=2547399 RepID=A0A4P7D606_9BURK|nr:nuclear transport factor 2 family protein [Paraburkholderia pallida]QBR02255.1 nuclear transport factor 2 family protein [Paraburkholderia pallida]